MSDKNRGGKWSCANMCWLAGAFFGVAVALVAAGRLGLGAITAVIIGLVVLAVTGWLLQRLFCQEMETQKKTPAYKPLDVAANPRDVVKVETAGSGSLSMAPKLPESGLDVHPGQGIEGAAEAATDGKDATAGKNATARKDATAGKDAGKAAETVAEKATPKVAPAATPVVTPKTAPTTPTPVSGGAADGRPAALAQARESGADDLKQIKGVGPKLEKLLNSMGIYHFDQISGWKSDQVAWMDENLKGFKGRVSRDTWVDQAGVLAKGGETEFSTRVKKGKVYKG